MALSDNALVTVAEAGAFCKLESATITTDTLLLEDLIEAATQDAEDYTGRCFISRSIVETHIGDGLTMIRLWKWPVLSVSDIKIDSTSIAAGGWTERLSIGRVYYTNGFDTDAEVIVYYTAGYGSRSQAQAACPTAKEYVLQLVARAYENREGADSVSISGLGSVSYTELAELRKMLNGLVVPQC